MIKSPPFSSEKQSKLPSQNPSPEKGKKKMTASQIHFRSISLPSRLHIINSTEFESELQKLSSYLSKNTPITSKTIQYGLLGLAELFNSLDKLAQNHQDRKSTQDSLESSVHLLVSCNNIQELIQMMRENVQALQSAFRRKGLNSFAMQNDMNSYCCFRKKMNKCIAKSLKTLKNLEYKNGSNVLPTEVTISIFKSILVFLSCPAGKSCGWNIVYKLMVTKSVDRDNSVISEVGCVDSVMNALRNDDYKVVDMQIVQKSLQNLDACVEGFEIGLKRLFRQLLQCRVTLLNIVNDY